MSINQSLICLIVLFLSRFLIGLVRISLTVKFFFPLVTPPIYEYFLVVFCIVQPSVLNR